MGPLFHPESLRPGGVQIPPHSHSGTLALWPLPVRLQLQSVQCCTMLVASVWLPSAGDQCCASLVAQWRVARELPRHSDTHCRPCCMRHSCVRGRSSLPQPTDCAHAHTHTRLASFTLTEPCVCARSFTPLHCYLPPLPTACLESSLEE